MTALTYFFETCYHHIRMASIFQLLSQCCLECCVELDSEVQSKIYGALAKSAMVMTWAVTARPVTWKSSYTTTSVINVNAVILFGVSMYYLDY